MIQSDFENVCVWCEQPILIYSQKWTETSNGDMHLLCWVDAHGEEESMDEIWQIEDYNEGDE